MWYHVSDTVTVFRKMWYRLPRPYFLKMWYQIPTSCLFECVIRYLYPVRLNPAYQIPAKISLPGVGNVHYR
jgi:hypothetical protein